MLENNEPENVFWHHLHTVLLYELKTLIFSTIFAKIREIPYSRNVKLQSAITPVQFKIEPWSLHIAGGFWQR